MKKCKFFSLLVLWFWCYSLSAQSIKGTVIDSDSHFPISDVNIKVLNSAYGTISNDKGEFSMSNVSRNAKLVFSAMGYASIQVPAGDSIREIQMKRSSILLNNNITITARRSEASQFSVSEAITVVDAQELQRTSPRTTPESLTGHPGIWIQKTNHGGGSPIIRGLVGNQVLLMVDGIRMNNTTYRYGPNQYLSTIDPGLIQRIEATRGSGSVLYGSDALGGVVQIISRSPHFEPGDNKFNGRLMSKWTSGDMEKCARGEFQWNAQKVAAQAGFSIRSFGDIVAGDNYGTLHPSGYDERSGDAKVLLRTGANGITTAAFQHHQQYKVPRYDQVVQGGYSLYNFDPQIRQLGYLRWETSSTHNILNSIRTTVALNRSAERIKSQRNGSAELKDQEDIINTYSASMEVHSVLTNNWEAQTGLEWYHDNVDSKAVVVNTSTSEKTNVRGSYADGATADNLSLFTSHTVDVGKFVFSAGARFNAVTLSVNDPAFGDQKFSPNAFVGNAGFAYHLHPCYSIFVNANTGFRAPNVDDVSRFGPVESTVFEIPTASLAPERAKTIELGMKANTKVFSGAITGYYTQLHDLIDRMPSTYLGKDTVENRGVYQKKNVNESFVRGVEAEGGIKISNPLSLHGNITYTYGENTSKAEPMRRIPPVFGKLSLLYNHTLGWWIRTDYVSAGKQKRLARGDLSDARIAARLRNGEMPSWNILNVYAGYTYKFLSVTIAGQNLFDRGYRVYASGVDGTGRSISVSLEGRF